MLRAIFSGNIAFLLLAGPFLGVPPSAGAVSDSMTPSQCVRSMTDLEREIASLPARIASCKEAGECQEFRVKLSRTVQRLNTTKRLCSDAARTPSPSSVPGAPANAGGVNLSKANTGAVAGLSTSVSPSLTASSVPDAIGGADPDAKADGGVGGFLGGLFSRVLDAGSTVLNTGVGVVRDVAGTLIDVPVGFVRDLAGAGRNLLQGNFADAGKGVGGAVVNAVGRTAGGVVDVLGRTLLGGVDLVDRLLLGKALPRPLTAEEKQLLNSVYKGSVNLAAVRVSIGSSSHLALPAHTISNNIYFKEPLGPLKNADGTLTWDGRTLIHETGHVWQSQHGGGDYLHKAMFANVKAAVTDGDRNKAYEWKPLAARGVPFSGLNPEQQASVIDNLAADELRPEGKKWLTDTETAYARAAMQLVYAGKGAP